VEGGKFVGRFLLERPKGGEVQRSHRLRREGGCGKIRVFFNLCEACPITQGKIKGRFRPINKRAIRGRKEKGLVWRRRVATETLNETLRGALWGEV